MNYNSIFMRKSVSPFSTLNSNIESLNTEIGKLKAKINSELKKLDKRFDIATDFVNKYIDVILSRDYYANEISAQYEYSSNLKLKKAMKDMVESYNKFLSNPDNVQTKANKTTKISFKDEHPKYFVKSGNDITGFDVQEHGVNRSPQRVKRIVSSKVLSPLGCTINGETVMAFIKLEFEQDSDFYGATERTTEIRLMMMPPNETKWVDAPTKVYDLQGGLIGDLNNMGVWDGPTPNSLDSNELILGYVGETYEERFKRIVFKTTDSGTILLIMLIPAMHDALTILRYDESKMCWFALINSRYGLDPNGDLYNKVLNPNGIYNYVGDGLLSHPGKPMLTGVSQDMGGNPVYHYDNLSIDETYVYDENGKKHYTLYICYGLGKEHEFANWEIGRIAATGSLYFYNSSLPENHIYVFTSTYSEDFSYQNNSFHNIMPRPTYSNPGWYWGANYSSYHDYYSNYSDVYPTGGDDYVSGIHTIPTCEYNYVVTSFRILMVSVASCKPGRGPILRFMFTFYLNPDKINGGEGVFNPNQKVYTFGCLDLDCETGTTSVSERSCFETTAKVGTIIEHETYTDTKIHSTHRPFCTTFDKEMKLYQFSERIRLPFADTIIWDDGSVNVSRRSFLDIKLINPEPKGRDHVIVDYFSPLPLYDYNITNVSNYTYAQYLYTESLFPTASLHDVAEMRDIPNDSIAMAYYKIIGGIFYVDNTDCVIQPDTFDVDYDVTHVPLLHMCMNPLSYTIADDQDMEIYPDSKVATKNKLGKILVPFLTNIYTLHLADIEQFFRCNIGNEGDYYDAPDYDFIYNGYRSGSWSVFTTTERYGEPVKKDIVMRLNVKGRYKKNQQYDHREFSNLYNNYGPADVIIPSAYRYSIDPNSEITFEYIYLGEDDVCRSVKFLTFGKSDPTTGTNDGLLHYKEHNIRCMPEDVEVIDVPFDIPLTEGYYIDMEHLQYHPVDYRYNTHREVCTRVAIAFKLTGKPNHDTCVTFDLVLYSEHYPFMRDTRRFTVTWNENEKSWYIDFIRKEYSSSRRIFPISGFECKLDVIKNVTDEYLRLVFYARRNDKYVDLNCADIGDIRNFHFLGYSPEFGKKASNYANEYMVKSRFFAEKYKDHNGPYTVNNHNMRLSITNVGVPVGTDDGETISYEIGLEGVQISESDINSGGSLLGTFTIFCGFETNLTNMNMDPIRIGEFL